MQSESQKYTSEVHSQNKSRLGGLASFGPSKSQRSSRQNMNMQQQQSVKETSIGRKIGTGE